jgi:hypothetical protein
MLVWILFVNTRRNPGIHLPYRAQTLGSEHIFSAQADLPAAPNRYLMVVARRLPAAAVCHRYFIVVPRPLPAAPFLVHRRYLIVVPRPLPAAPLVVRRVYLLVVPRLVLRPLLAATGEEHSAD